MNPKTGEITSETPTPNKLHEFITQKEETKIEKHENGVKNTPQKKEENTSAKKPQEET